MKEIALVTLYVMNSFTFNSAMERVQKRRLPLTTTITILDTFKCPRSNCQMGFESEYELSAHAKAHDECDGKIYYCDKCPVHYLRKKDLTAHSKRHIIKKETAVIDLTPSAPFILKRLSQETESMADTKKEMRDLANAPMIAAFEFMAAAQPRTIVKMRYKKIADSYLCHACNIIYKERVAYFNHLFGTHNYTFGSHTSSCHNKKAH
jgi:hypothetical protein